VSEAATVPEATPEIRRIGIIGAGQMGSGIAHVCALAGYDVRISDLDPAALERAQGLIDRNLTRQVARGKISEQDRGAALKRISTNTDYAPFRDCDIVIEAATEKEDVKREIFKKLVPMLNPAALIASNTSSISITRLAASTDRPGRFIGMHFMNPVPVMTLVEVIRDEGESGKSLHRPGLRREPSLIGLGAPVDVVGRSRRHAQVVKEPRLPGQDRNGDVAKRVLELAFVDGHPGEPHSVHPYPRLSAKVLAIDEHDGVVGGNGRCRDDRLSPFVRERRGGQRECQKQNRWSREQARHEVSRRRDSDA